MKDLSEIDVRSYDFSMYDLIVAEMVKQYLIDNPTALDTVVSPEIIKPDFTRKEPPELLSSRMKGKALAALIDSASEKMKGQLMRWRNSTDANGVITSIAEQVESLPIDGAGFVETRLEDGKFASFIADCYVALHY